MSSWDRFCTPSAVTTDRKYGALMPVSSTSTHVLRILQVTAKLDSLVKTRFEEVPAL